jgi:hypothetical protein
MNRFQNFLGALLLIITLISCDQTEKEVRYSEDVAPIINSYCITCHSGTGASAGLLLTNYQEVKAAAESGKLSDRINDVSAPMPPSGLMSSSNRTTIEEWIKGSHLQ